MGFVLDPGPRTCCGGGGVLLLIKHGHWNNLRRAASFIGYDCTVRDRLVRVTPGASPIAFRKRRLGVILCALLPGARIGEPPAATHAPHSYRLPTWAEHGLPHPVHPDIPRAMSSSSKITNYDALEATTSIESITANEGNLTVLRLLRDDDGDLTRLCICDEAYDRGEYHPKSSEELGWLGHFAKKSAHLEELGLNGEDAFYNCSQQSVDRFFEDIGQCTRIRTLNFTWRNDLPEIMHMLESAIENNNIKHWYSVECYLDETGAKYIFNSLRDMLGLENLIICSADEDHDLNDGIMAGCIPSLAACTAMRKLTLYGLDLSTSSCAALNAVFPRMAALRVLDLSDNAIGNNDVEELVHGLTECKHLHSLGLNNNRIGDDGLEMLIQGLPASVDNLVLSSNAIVLARQLPLLRFKKFELSWTTLSPGGPRVIAASLADPECRLEVLELRGANIGDEGAEILSTSLRSNQRLAVLALANNNITETGWNAFLPVLRDTTSINATHGSNHTLTHLGTLTYLGSIPTGVERMLRLNHDQDKNLVAAKKILQTHTLNMKPLFGRNLDMLPNLVAWLDRFAENRLDLKLSSIFDFARAMPMEVVEGFSGEKKEKKRRHGRSA